MTTLDEVATERLEAWSAQHLRRQLHETMRLDESRVQKDGREIISFSCNDYLGLSRHPMVLEEAKEALLTYGAGAGASRLVTGSHPLYRALEEALAEQKAYQAARIFGSGYLANIGVITSLCGSGDLILLDKLSHACLLDGAQLSGARWMRFRHNEPEDLARLLEKHRGSYRHCLIITETIFSMDGDCAPLQAFSTLANAHGAWLMADDAHGLFDTPSENKSSNPASAPLILTGTLSKALGSYGGYVCASKIVIDYLTSAARSLIYTTGLPPATIASAHAALRLAQSEPHRALQSRAYAQQFCAALALPAAQSQIVPVLFGEAEAALSASQTLRSLGFLVTAIRPPTVPAGTARLRVSFSAAHKSEQIDALCEAIKPLLVKENAA